jgi:hypothetical protein
MIPEKKYKHNKIGVTYRCARYDNCGWAAAMDCQHDKEHAHYADCDKPCVTDGGLRLSGICEPIQTKCAADCSACIEYARDKEWAKYVLDNWNGTKLEETKANISDVYAIVAFPLADFDALKKLAEE